MLKVTDQAGYQVAIPSQPKRIISLVPSQTELLFDMGLEKEIVGVTKFCVHPKELIKSKPNIGGTKNINTKKIKSLCPDLIIANKEENNKADIEKLTEIAPVWISNIVTMNDVYNMISVLGKITGKAKEAISISSKIKNSLELLNKITSNHQPLKVAYCIWENPMMVAGKDTFINHILSLCKFKNSFNYRKERYPIITLGELNTAKPDIILLSSEPYPYKMKHQTLYNQLAPDAQVILVDGQMFSWYGSRVAEFPYYFKKILALLKQP